MRVDGLTVRLTVDRATVNLQKGPLTCEDALEVDRLTVTLRTIALGGLRVTGREQREKNGNYRQPSTYRQPQSIEHKMRTAAPSLPTARRYGLRRGVALRVWCTCQEGAIQPGGWSFRPRREWEADTRRLGGWDWLGVVDIREPMSALNLWRAHVEESRASEQAYTMDDVESETLGDPQ